MSVNISAVGGYAAPTNSGNLDDSVLRVCIASNDINISSIKEDIELMKADIADLKSDLADLKAIMDDVYNSVSHSLKVSVL